MTDAPPARPPPPRTPSPGGEKIVAVVLATMAIVLAWVWFALRDGSTAEAALRFDLTNALLSATSGDCMDVEDLSFAGETQRLIVRAPGPVLRPRSGPMQIEGYTNANLPDLREAPPYLACELRSATPVPAGAPATRNQVDLFDLNGFGMPAGTMCALKLIRPTAVTWNGQVRRKAHDVYLYRYDRVEGPWHIFFGGDVPVLGTMMREYVDPHGTIVRQRFNHPDACR